MPFYAFLTNHFHQYIPDKQAAAQHPESVDCQARNQNSAWFTLRAMRHQ